MVAPPRNDQARPSWISWARITGLRAQERPPTSPHAQISSAPPYSAKKTAVVNVTAAFPGEKLNTSSDGVDQQQHRLDRGQARGHLERGRDSVDLEGSHNGKQYL